MPIRRFWKLNLQSGFQIAVLLRQLLVGDIIAGFVEGFSVEHVLREWCSYRPGWLNLPVVLRGAKGLAILTVVKAGVLLAYKLGTGLVIARRSDGTWSAPSAIFSIGLGCGAQCCGRTCGESGGSRSSGRG
ncbi:hypothetical protein F3Y22_tig00111758pilonHSYRG00268 [Hibiscus syriacus]|uniref:Uncharacterized protein n=1 Tax=Hibiscus syriacus TaxID=106335 RepID=A0A6A2XG41_HIBSY|nr:hypothetical protein F3Y22_tig00111758pilonHSYRG00268 [Hibiscus syriacus]